MTNEEARNVIEKYLKCRNEPCNDVRLCSECGLNTNESEQDEAFKLAIEALKCMSLNADIINADAMYKLFITGEMTMEDFKKMCGDVKAIKALSRSEFPNSCHDGDKDINVPCKDTISRQDAIDAVSEGCQEWRGIFEGCKEKLLSLPSIQPEPTLEQIKEYCHKRCLSIVDNALLYKYAQAEIHPKSARTFVELVVEYPDPELCTYKEYKGKPYYSIKYIENGETYVGYGTYNPEVLSQYLKEYFISFAQPEIIYCKDCKYWREHKYVKETKRYIPFCGFHAIYTKAEDFCSRAERRTDGRD